MKLRNVLLLVVLGLTIPDADAQTETILHVFVGSANDGLYPKGTLVEGDDGNFYGTTFGGGNTNSFSSWIGCGTVFRISPSGTHTSLYFFGTSPSDGSQPVAGLVKGSDGNFYGTTQRGGTNAIGSGGLGTVFRISPGGSYTNLYSFPGYAGDGYFPQAGLVQGSDGNFYGTTYGGGTNGYGIVFRISPDGKEETVCTFVVWAGNGGYTVPGVVQGSEGDFYGTTVNGGTGTTCFAGCGTVFRISPSGSFTNLHSFVGYPSDGANPYAGLIQGSDGYFYGTTYERDDFPGHAPMEGTVFKISASGAFMTMYSFPQGANPKAALAQGSDGSFYGTTSSGGLGVAGTVFRLTLVPQKPALTLTGRTLNLTWNTEVGRVCQLQYTSDLSSANWTNLGSPFTATRATFSATESVLNAPQRFYRLALLP